MSAYTETPIQFIKDPVTGLYTTDRPILWETGYEGSNWIVEIPPEYKNDGPSIPWCLSWFADADNPAYWKAARVHDYYLDKGWSRPSAAAEFYSALRADGVSKTMATLMFLSVFFWTTVLPGIDSVRTKTTTPMDAPIPPEEEKRLTIQKMEANPVDVHPGSNI